MPREELAFRPAPTSKATLVLDSSIRATPRVGVNGPCQKQRNSGDGGAKRDLLVKFLCKNLILLCSFPIW